MALWLRSSGADFEDRFKALLALKREQSADVNDKVEFYSGVGSIRHYLVIEQDQRRVVYHGRGPSGSLEPHILREGSITLDPPGIALALADLYFGTTLSDAQQPPEGRTG